MLQPCVFLVASCLFFHLTENRAASKSMQVERSLAVFRLADRSNNGVIEREAQARAVKLKSRS